MTKHITITEAAAFVQDGMTLGLGGMTLYRRPTAYVKALLARPKRPRDLTLFGFTHGFEADVLIGAGCVAATRCCYFGLDSFGLAPMFTERASRGDIQVIEETESSIGSGLRARAAGIGFMPSMAWIGTDLPTLRPDVKTITDPYTGQTLMAFPSIRVNVAVLHGLECDASGNLAINQNVAIDLELAIAADIVIATYERSVDRLAKSADRQILPSPVIDYAVHAPGGALPASCYPDYPLDGAALMAYTEACAGGRFEDYLAAWLSEER